MCLQRAHVSHAQQMLTWVDVVMEAKASVSCSLLGGGQSMAVTCETRLPVEKRPHQLIS